MSQIGYLLGEVPDTWDRIPGWDGRQRGGRALAYLRPMLEESPDGLKPDPTGPYGRRSEGWDPHGYLREGTTPRPARERRIEGRRRIGIRAVERVERGRCPHELARESGISTEELIRWARMDLRMRERAETARAAEAREAARLARTQRIAARRAAEEIPMPEVRREGAPPVVDRDTRPQAATLEIRG